MPDTSCRAARARDGGASSIAPAGAGATRGLLAGDASFRRYHRVDRDGRRAVLMDAPPPMEDVRPFLAIAAICCGSASARRRSWPRTSSRASCCSRISATTPTRACSPAAPTRPRSTRWRSTLLIELHRRFDGASAADVPRYDEARALREVDAAARLVLAGGRWAAPASDALRASYSAAWRRGAGRALWSAPDTLALFDFHVDNLMIVCRPQRRRRLRPARFPGRGDRRRSPTTSSRCWRMPAATFRAPSSRRCASAIAAAFPRLDRAAFDRSYAAIGAQRNDAHHRHLHAAAAARRQAALSAIIPRVWRLLEDDLAHPALAPVRTGSTARASRRRRIAPKAIAA